MIVSKPLPHWKSRKSRVILQTPIQHLRRLFFRVKGKVKIKYTEMSLLRKFQKLQSLEYEIDKTMYNFVRICF